MLHLQNFKFPELGPCLTADVLIGLDCADLHYLVHEPDAKKWPLVAFSLNKVYVDFWEGMHLSSWKIYDSIDHVVACGFMACHPKFQQESHFTSSYKHFQIE